MHETIITTAVHLSEVYYYLLRETAEVTAKEILKELDFEYFAITPEFALKAAAYRHKHREKKLSYADCLGYVIAVHNGLFFLTGDKGFEHIDKVTFVK